MRTTVDIRLESINKQSKKKFANIYEALKTLGLITYEKYCNSKELTNDFEEWKLLLSITDNGQYRQRMNPSTHINPYREDWNCLINAWAKTIDQIQEQTNNEFYQGGFEKISQAFETGTDSNDIEAAYRACIMLARMIIQKIEVNNIYNSVINKLNNPYLKVDLEKNARKGMVLIPCGYVGNRPPSFKGLTHEDDTWAIDCNNKKDTIIASYLYVSNYEYMQDLKLLNKLN